MKISRHVFDKMVERDLFTWNSMILAYVCNELLDLAMEILNYMILEGFEPYIITWNIVMDVIIDWDFMIRYVKVLNI